MTMQTPFEVSFHFASIPGSPNNSLYSSPKEYSKILPFFLLPKCLTHYNIKEPIVLGLVSPNSLISRRGLWSCFVDALWRTFYFVCIPGNPDNSLQNIFKVALFLLPKCLTTTSLTLTLKNQSYSGSWVQTVLSAEGGFGAGTSTVITISGIASGPSPPNPFLGSLKVTRYGNKGQKVQK